MRYLLCSCTLILLVGCGDAPPTPSIPRGAMGTPVVGSVWAVTVESVKLLTQLDEPIGGGSLSSPLRPQGRWLEVWATVRNQTNQPQRTAPADWIVITTTGAQYPAYDPRYEYAAYDDYIHSLAHEPLGLGVLPRTSVAIIADFDVPADLPTHGPALHIARQARIALNSIVSPAPSPAP